MNPDYGIILWVLIGAMAGWVGSMIMGSNARQGAMANILIGIAGALVGGYITQHFFGDRLGDNGLVTSFGVALLGSCLIIAVGKLISGRRNTML